MLERNTEVKQPPPLVSVVVATWNSEKTLRRCLDSIASQSLRDVQLIVADGGSSDRTMGILDDYGDRISARWSRPDRGVYDAWNQALCVASGKWILFIGSDDFLVSADALELCAPRLEREATSAFVSFPTLQYSAHNGRSRLICGSVAQAQKRASLGQMPFPHPSTFHRREPLSRTGGFRDDLKIAGDLDVALRLMPEGLEFETEPVLVEMATGGLSTSGKTAPLKWREILAVRRTHGLPAFTIADAFPAVLDAGRWARDKLSSHRRSSP